MFYIQYVKLIKKGDIIKMDISKLKTPEQKFYFKLKKIYENQEIPVRKAAKIMGICFKTMIKYIDYYDIPRRKRGRKPEYLKDFYKVGGIN